MRRYCRVNQRIALPLLQELLGVREHLGFAFVVRRRKIDECLPEYAAHARSFGFLGHSIFEVIHIGESRDP